MIKRVEWEGAIPPVETLVHQRKDGKWEAIPKSPNRSETTGNMARSMGDGRIVGYTDEPDNGISIQYGRKEVEFVPRQTASDGHIVIPLDLDDDGEYKPFGEWVGEISTYGDAYDIGNGLFLVSSPPNYMRVLTREQAYKATWNRTAKWFERDMDIYNGDREP